MKIPSLLFTVTFCFLSTFTFSQVIEWQNTIGGSGDDRLTSIAQTLNGGYILGGWSESDISGDKTEDSNGNLDYWIVKIDSTGVIEWQNTIGGNSDDNLTCIQQTSDGGYILGGFSFSGLSGDKTENSNGNFDYWIVKTDSLGVIQWQNTIGGSGGDYLQSINQTTDGGFILGGWSASNISGDKTENSFGFADFWIVKTDEFGIIQWQNTIGGADEDALKSVEQTTDGGYILGGHSLSNISGDKTENSMGNYDQWIVKIDASGNIQWQNTIGGSGYDYLNSMQQTSDGEYILAGHSGSNISGDKTENNIGGYDIWIVKVDTSGIINWQNTIGGNDSEVLTSIKQTVDEGFILGGYSKSDLAGDKTENCIGNYDYWFFKTDASGMILWQNTIGGSADDEIFCLELTMNGSYIMGGLSISNISDDKTENCIGGHDFWVVKVTDQYNLVSGKLFLDANSNSTQDAGDLPVENKKIIATNTGRFDFSNQNGAYDVSLMGSGNFSISTVSLDYYVTVPITHSAIFNGILQTDSLNDFAFQATGVFNDLCISITPLSQFRSGFFGYYQISYENVGTTTLNPTIIFFPDINMGYISGTPPEDAVTADSIVWNFGPLGPYETGSIFLKVYVNVGVPLNIMINSIVRVEPVANDANPQCNESNWEAPITGSFDPNDIQVNEDTLYTTNFPNPPYLEYLIRFQNTGNDTAFTVKVLNPVDTFKLDLNTFEFVASSHPVNINWINWERNMEFTFENILLPDSNINEPASHGFIRYRIKPKATLTVNDSITNIAAIYFDFNAPVITNTAVTRIEIPTSINEQARTSDPLLLYPNPANSMLTIETDMLLSSKNALLISDIEGRTLYSKSLSSYKHTLDISFLSDGIYFVEIRSEEKIVRGRFVKN